MENELTCCVCLDLFTEPLMLPCSHNFCKKCLLDLFHHNRGVQLQDRQRPPQIACPKCRRDIFPLDHWNGIENLPMNKALDNIVRVYKTSPKADFEDNIRRCLTHLKPLCHYCKTCKKTVCEVCVPEAHNGFGHYVKTLSDFINEEKDTAKASIHELETLRHSVIARDTEVTALILNSKIREKEYRKSVEDHFTVIKQCVNVQQSKVLEDLCSQLIQSRVSLEKVAEKISSLRSQIRDLRNSHKEALHEINPDRQLKLLQSLTLRLSAFLAFQAKGLSHVPITLIEQDGRLENVESVLNSIRDLSWINTTVKHSDEDIQTREYGTQTDHNTTRTPALTQAVCENKPPKKPEHRRKQTLVHKADILQEEMPPATKDEKNLLGQYLANATKELLQLTGGNETGQTRVNTPKRTTATLSETILELQNLQMDHKAQQLGDNCDTTSGCGKDKLVTDDVEVGDKFTHSDSPICRLSSSEIIESNRGKAVALQTHLSWPLTKNDNFAGILVQANSMSNNSESQDILHSGGLSLSPSAAGGIASPTNTENHLNGADSAGDGFYPVDCSNADEGGASSPVVTPQFCGVGARPKVRQTPTITNGAVGVVESKDDKKMTASLKEGFSSAMCSIKSLCRVGFNTTNKDSDLDVNANDNGDIGAAAACQPIRSASVSASITAKRPDIHSHAGMACRSVGTSPLMFDSSRESLSYPSVWSNFSFNDSNHLQHSKQETSSGNMFTKENSVSPTSSFKLNSQWKPVNLFDTNPSSTFTHSPNFALKETSFDKVNPVNIWSPTKCTENIIKDSQKIQAVASVGSLKKESDNDGVNVIGGNLTSNSTAFDFISPVGQNQMHRVDKKIKSRKIKVRKHNQTK